MQPMRYKEPKEPSKLIWITSREPPENYQRLNEDIPEYELFLGRIEEIKLAPPFHHPKIAYHEDNRRIGRPVKDILYYPDADCFYIETDEVGG